MQVAEYSVSGVHLGAECRLYELALGDSQGLC